MKHSSEVPDWLREMRASYAGSADRKLSDLADAISALERDPGDPDIRLRLHTLLHNLIGSGASYGFPSISVIARRLSSALKRATDGQVVVESGLVGILRNGLEELREAFRLAGSHSERP